MAFRHNSVIVRFGVLAVRLVFDEDGRLDRQELILNMLALA
jgi:hypothetical protein